MKTEELMQFVDVIVKIEIKENQEVPYICGTFVGWLKYDEKFKMFTINHPYDIDKKAVNSGEASFNPVDITVIKPATQKETLTWYKEYQKFHMEVMMDKGYDSCEIEKYNEILLNKK